MQMDLCQQLFDIEQIKQLKARYFRYVDCKDWPGFAALFAPGAIFDISDDVVGCVITGPAAIVKAASIPLANCVTIHHGHCPEIDITSPTSATGIWAMEDRLMWRDAAAESSKSLHGFGHYVETYTKTDNHWVIQSLKLTRLRVERLPGHDV